MSIHVPLPWPGEGDAFDEVDAIEAKAQPTLDDLARLDMLTRHPSSLVAMSARVTAGCIRNRGGATQAGAPPAQVAAAGELLSPSEERCSAAPDQDQPAADAGTPDPLPAAAADEVSARSTGPDRIREESPIDPGSDRKGETGKKVGGSAPKELAESPKQPITLSTTHVVDYVMGEAEAMASGKFVSYLRVSTAKQGASGLGLEAQRQAVTDFLAGGPVIREFVEVESGKRADRPKLAEALALCRLHGATLVIAKLDRLSRDAHFLLGLEKAGVDFIAADMPTANRLTVGIMAMVADEERRMISARTKAALAAKARWYAGLTEVERDELRAQGRPVQLGGDKGRLAEVRARGTVAGVAVRQRRAASRAADIAPMIVELQAEGATSLGQLAAALTERGIPTSRGGARWSSMQVSRILKAGAHGT